MTPNPTQPALVALANNLDPVGDGQPMPHSRLPSIALADVAGLLVNGRVPSSLLPAAAVTSVSSQVAMLALAAAVGDVALRTDLAPVRAYQLSALPASTLGNWTFVGNVITSTDAVPEGSTNLYYTTARASGVVSAAITALGLGSAATHAASDFDAAGLAAAALAAATASAAGSFIPRSGIAYSDIGTGITGDISMSGHSFGNVAQIQVGNIISTAGNQAMQVVGNGDIYFGRQICAGNLPTSASGLSSGFFWVDPAAGYVIKRVP